MLAEDDVILGEAIEYGLILNGYRVDWFKNGSQANQASQTEDYDAIILDLGLPDLSGLQILDHLRDQKKTTPVLILTARDKIGDRVNGLDKGADDYMVKPFDMDELNARLRAIIRRRYGRVDTNIVFDDLVINPSDYTLAYKGNPIELPRHEFNLLTKLVGSAGRVFSQSEIEDYLYSFSNEVGSNTVQVYIHNIRKKIDKSLIRTVRGVGYVVDKK